MLYLLLFGVVASAGLATPTPRRLQLDDPPGLFDNFDGPGDGPGPRQETDMCPPSFQSEEEELKDWLYSNRLQFLREGLDFAGIRTIGGLQSLFLRLPRRMLARNFRLSDTQVRNVERVLERDRMNTDPCVQARRTNRRGSRQQRQQRQVNPRQQQRNRQENQRAGAAAWGGPRVNQNRNIAGAVDEVDEQADIYGDEQNEQNDYASYRLVKVSGSTEGDGPEGDANLVDGDFMLVRDIQELVENEIESQERERKEREEREEKDREEKERYEEEREEREERGREGKEEIEQREREETEREIREQMQREERELREQIQREEKEREEKKKEEEKREEREMEEKEREIRKKNRKRKNTRIGRIGQKTKRKR